MMLTLYLKIALRNIWKYKTQSLTGIFGLAFAIACLVPTLFWMHYETSYDSFYPEAERICRIYTLEKQSGKENKGSSRIVEKKLHEYFPAVKSSAAFLTGQENCRTEKMPQIRLSMLYADSTFFSVFPQTVVSSNAKQPLQVLNDMVLTETVAIRLFGDAEKAIGQQVQTTMNAALPPYTVTAVVKDPPPNTNLSFEAIIFHDMLKSFSEWPEDQQWKTFFMELYVKLDPQSNISEMSEQLRDFTSRLGTNSDIELRMMPISDVRHNLNKDVPFTLNFIGLFVASGLLMLFSGLFNFLNLNLDLFRQRIREFSLRIVNGATVGQLIRQMLFELASAILLALLPACFFVFIVRPLFCGLLDIEMGMLQMILIFIVCSIGVMALALFIGFILFWRLSHMSIRPQSERKITGQPVSRRIAVILQLAVSLVFIIAALVVMMQMHFVNNKDLGFDRHGLIQLSGFTDYSGKVQDALIQKLSAIPQVESITDASFEPQHNVNPFTITTEVEWQGKPQHEMLAFDRIFTDDRFAITLGLKMIDGKWWDKGQMQKIIINEEAVRVMQLSEPVGTIIRMPSPEDDSMTEYEVAGVVNDFHTLSLRNRIHPVFFMPSSYPNNVLYIHVVPGQELEAMQRIAAILPGVNATLADVRLTTVSELYDRLSRSEQVGLKMFSVVAVVCLMISLIGIYAVASATTHRRRKEIAIRKVVGAEVSNIIGMFFREYTTLVIITGIVALPLAYIVMNNWLEGYAYRTNIPCWLLASVVTGVIAVVLLTVWGQVLKAANSNPAEVVKSE